MPRYQLSPFVDHLKIIDDLTGPHSTANLDALLDGLGLPFDAIDPIKMATWEALAVAIQDAFAAGVACGLHPELLLLASKGDGAGDGA